ncbi:MAG: hypothetical protein ACYDAA_19060 [Syntrophales bacterium]
MRNLGLLAVIATLALVAACGGGDDGAGRGIDLGAPNIGRYEGDWSRCVPAGTGSRQETLDFTRYSDNTVVFLALAFTYPSSDCSGAATFTSSTGNVVFHGTKTIAGATVDKAIVNTEGGAAEKQVYLIQGAGTGPFTLTAGRIGSGVDADGYPTTLDSSSFLKGGAALERYLGTWKSGCIAAEGGSRREILTLTKISDMSAALTWEWPGYSSSNCSGLSMGLVEQGSFLLQGTKTIGTDAVDKVILSFDAPNPAKRMIFLVKDTRPATLIYGRIDGGADPDGYPTTLNGSVLTKQ